MTGCEFTRPLRLDRIGAAPVTESIDADAAERSALARRFGLMAIDRLAATLAVARDGAAIRLHGTIDAQVTQACVASGAPVAATITAPVELRYVAAADTASFPDEDVELAGEELDTLTHDGRAIDLGEAAAQTLALALDPYPRSPDADRALREAGVLPPEAAGPFAALAALKRR